MYIRRGILMGCLTPIIVILLIGAGIVTYENITGRDPVTELQDEIHPPSEEEIRTRKRREEALESHKERINNPQARAQDAQEIINRLNQRMYQAENPTRFSDGETIILSEEYAHSFYIIFPLITESKTKTFQSIEWQGSLTYERDVFDNGNVSEKEITFSQHGGRCVHLPTLSSTIGSQAPLEVSFSIDRRPPNSPPPLIASSCPYTQNDKNDRSTLDTWYETFR